MAKQNVKKHRQTNPNIDKYAAIAKVPVKVTLMHGNNALDEFEDVIHLEFNPKTIERRECARRMGFLIVLDGHTAETALLTIASEEVKIHVGEAMKKLAHTDFIKQTSGRKIHVH